MSARSRASSGADPVGEASPGEASLSEAGGDVASSGEGAGDEEEDEEEEGGLPGDGEDYRQTAQTLLANAITERAMKVCVCISRVCLCALSCVRLILRAR